MNNNLRESLYTHWHSGKRFEWRWDEIYRSFGKGNAFGETRLAFYDNGIYYQHSHPYPYHCFPLNLFFTFTPTHFVMPSPLCAIISAFTISLKPNVIVNSHQIFQVQKMMKLLFEEFSHMLTVMCAHSFSLILPPLLSLALFWVSLNWYVKNTVWVCIFICVAGPWNEYSRTPHNNIIFAQRKRHRTFSHYLVTHPQIVSNNNKLMCDSWDMLSMSGVWFHVNGRKTKQESNTLRSAT